MVMISSISKFIFIATLATSLFAHMSLSFDYFSIIDYSQDDLTSTSKLIELFNSWMLKHNKAYNDIDEKIYRFEIFKDNLKYIDETNKKNDGYWLGLNKFADLSYDEFKEKYLGSIVEISETEESYDEEFNYEHVVDLPENFDWREKGAVNPIKNQGSCGSCWAFSTVSSVEGLNKIKNGSLVSLSEQQLIDCNKKNHGCNGGSQPVAFQYMIDNGVHLEKNYPYEGKQNVCRANNVTDPTVSISGYKRVRSRCEKSLLKAITIVPVSVAVDASRAFQHYKGGIFKGPCKLKLNHAVNAIGYGKSGRNKYLIIRNSWGTGWGEKGYMRLERLSGKHSPGRCGVYLSSYYPV